MTVIERHLDLPLREALKIMQRRIVGATMYRGIHCTKCPLDMWVYREMIVKSKPDFIVEIGAGRGGSTLAFADFCDLAGAGKVFAIDVEDKIDRRVLPNPRIEYFIGDAADLFPRIKTLVSGSVLVIDDSSHKYDETLEILEKYSQLIQVGGYIVIEDTNNLMLVPGPKGAGEAVGTFLQGHPEFEADRTKESFFITWNPRGYLRRVR